MKRSLVFFSLFALLGGCSSSSGDGTGGTGGSDGVAIDTFNVALAGAFIPFEAARRQPIYDAIAANDSDIICLQEVWTQEDKEMIQTAAAQAYPHAVLFENTLDTPIDDDTDQQGEVPPTPTEVPCPDRDVGDQNIADQMDQAIDCLRQFCSTTTPDDDGGRTTSAECAESSCVPAVAGLLVGEDPQQQRCYACIITQLPTETFGYMRNSCSTVVNQDLAFRGQNGVMILSRHPLKDEEELVIPGTWNRRTILSATAELPNGAELDIYCNHLTPLFDSFTFPYTGQYGDGMTDVGGWQAEQELQAEKLINYVTETSGDRPAVILGDLNTGRAFPAQDIVAEGEETLNLLEAAFAPAYTAEYLEAPLCTFCSTNPVTNPTDDPAETSVWIDHIQLHNLESDSVLSTARIFDEDVVPVDDMMVPLSDHFGMRSVIDVP
jgi:endonuclease/exonuclease/phosphatase family metal-dependent hydrolase